MTPVWHALCGDAGKLRACATCARNPANQDEAKQSPHQVWMMPARSGDRCGDHMQRQPVKRPTKG